MISIGNYNNGLHKELKKRKGSFS